MSLDDASTRDPRGRSIPFLSLRGSTTHVPAYEERNPCYEKLYFYSNVFMFDTENIHLLTFNSGSSI
jgi:hypothetical protein